MLRIGLVDVGLVDRQILLEAVCDQDQSQIRHTTNRALIHGTLDSIDLHAQVDSKRGTLTDHTPPDLVHLSLITFALCMYTKAMASTLIDAKLWIDACEARIEGC
jgi:hypothetical protein